MDSAAARLAFARVVSLWRGSASPSDQPVRELAQPSELRSREGKVAIYTENGVVSHVRVDQVFCDGWGAEAKLTIISSPGLVTGQATGLVGSAYTVRCRWEFLSTGRAGWHSAGQGCVWSLFFDPRLIQEVVELGVSLHGKVNRSARLRTLRERLSRAYKEDCTP